jgi:amino acid adenylation domain-containing protein/non-ribosomal peptide synthase protein (TIGR01720 family)
MNPDTMPGLAGLSEEQRRLLALLLEEQGFSTSRAQPIPRRGAAGPVPLAPAQHRLWVIDRIDPGSSAYNVPSGVRMRGPLDVRALRRALGEVVRRHEALRTVFRETEDEPVQVVRDPAPVPLPVVELAGLPVDGRERELARLAAAEAALPFDLERGPLLRFTLLRLAEAESVVLLTLHHIVSDAGSMQVLVEEVSTLYAAYARGAPSPLEDLPVQYPDYALWQRSPAQEEARARQLDHWRERLRGVPRLLEVPTDRPRSAAPGSAAATVPVDVPPPTADALRSLAGREQGTLLMVLLAGWQLLLGRWADTGDVVVGMPVSGRTRRETEGMIGFFVNTLVVRTDLSGDPTARELAARVREGVLGAQDHGDVPFERLVDAVGVERDPAYPPLFQVAFSLAGSGGGGAGKGGAGAGGALRLAGIELERLAGGATGAKYDLALELFDDRTRVGGLVEYRPALFDAATVERMAAQLEHVLAWMGAGPDRRLSELCLLAGAERDQVLAEWGGAGAGLPPACLHDAFAAHARRDPGAVALRFESRSLRYGELDARANRLARALRARGIVPERRVGIWLERGPGMVVAVLAVLRAGGAYVPLDPAYPPERVALLLADAGARLLVGQESLLERLPAPPCPVLCPEREAEALAAGGAGPVEGGALPESLAYVIYTSGSTGTPKGVLVEHRSAAGLIAASCESFGMEPGTPVLQAASLTFDASVLELFVALSGGGTVVLVRRDTLLDAEALAGVLREERVGMVFTPPALLGPLAEDDFPELRTLVVGGDRCTAETVERWAPGRRMLNAYGPTEATIYATAAACRAGSREAPAIGRPVAGVRAYVLDRALQPVPARVAGELHLGGAGVARGYHARPELTAASFVPDPYSGAAGARMYRTGDRVRWRPDGELEFLGRADEQVKVRGFRIEPGEIESALLRHPAVRDAVVVTREDAPGRRRLVAYLVAEGAVPPPAELRAWLGERIPEYMVPAAFVGLDALPVTANRKVDRQALPAPDESAGGTRAYTAPRTPAEQVLAEVWKGVLGVERVGADDGFFDLGGDSILAIQAVSRARRAGLHLTARQVFEHPTLAALARVAGTAAAVQAQQGAVTGPVEPTPVQRWWFDTPSPARHHWNMSRMVAVLEGTDGAALERVFARLLEHHDALRSRFAQRGGEWLQEIAAPGGAAPVVRIDLSAVAEARRSGALERAAAALQASLDLERGPLLRVGLFERGAGRSARLLVVVHHLVVDAVSWGILLEDLRAAAGQAARGEPVSLPPKTTSFQAWSRRLAEHARAGGFDAEIPFWTAPEREGIAPLPTDFPAEPGANTEARARSVHHRLDAADTQALLHEVARAYRTQVNDVLLAALARTLAAWTGDGRVLVALEGHGREELFPDVDLSRTVGWFTTVHPVLLDVRGAAGEGEALKAVKEQLRAVPGRGIGYGALRRLAADPEVRARLERLPQAEVSLNYLGQADSGPAPAPGAEAVPDGGMESRGPDFDPGTVRMHLLEVSAVVEDGRLRVEWTYGSAFHRAETVERLADRFLAELRALIAHCTAPGAGGYTPSDFPLARLTQARLDALAGSDRGIEDVYPLTPLQEGMLFHTLLEPEGGVYVGQLGFELAGEVDRGAFARAWQEVTERHAILRTAFVQAGGGGPLQVVRREARLDEVAWEDWRGLPREEQDARLEAFLERDRARGIDPSRPPLMRLALFRTGDAAHRLVWTQHHLVMDGWSMPIIFRDVAALYRAQLRGVPAQLPPARPYRDYVAWLQRRDMAEAERFWREALAGFAAPTPLGVERAPDAVRAGEEPAYRRAERRFAPAVSGVVRDAAREYGITPNTLVQGAWALLLSHYSGEDDVVFGSTVSGRPAEVEGVEEMVGLFINTLPVRARVRPERSVAGFLRDLQGWNVAMREHEYAPLVQVGRWSEVPPGTPLFESLLVFENFPAALAGGGAPAADAPELAVALAGALEQASFPLAFNVALGDDLAVEAHHTTGRFDPAAVGRVLEQLEVVLAGLAADPLRRLDEVPLLPAAERERVLGAWSRAEGPAPEPRALHEAFAERAARDPRAAALVFEDRTLTYGELDRRAGLLARGLRARAVGPDVRVALCAERSPELVVAALAVLRAGGAYVPLDPAYPAERLAFMLADSGARLLLAHEEVLPRLPEHGAELVILRSDGGPALPVPAAGDREGAGAGREPFPPDAAAYVIYTSGSTGTPKGVVVPHRGLAAVAHSQARLFGVGPGDRVLQFASPGFDASVFEMVMALASGAALVLAPREALLPGAGLAELLLRERVSVATLPPTALAALPAGDYPALRVVTVAGEACPAELVDAWGRGRRFFNLYGPTETTIWATAAECAPGGGRPPIGRPIVGARTFVLDARHRPAGTGVPGELYVGGAGVARGYLGRPDLTAERFVPDPLSGEPGARLYRTGDRVRRRPDGALEFLGRMDHQVKVRGFRIEPGEIEAALLRRPGVREAVVLAREDVPGDRRLVAYLTASGAAFSPDELRAWLRGVLPEHMVPGAFVLLDALPLTPSGKVDRKALPAPEARSRGARAYVAPRDHVEMTLAQVWEEVLGVRPVGVTDDFFALGGHSLLAMRLAEEIEQRTGSRLSLAAFLAEPRIESVAALLRTAAAPADPSLLACLQESGSRTPLFFVHPAGGNVLWYLALARHLGPDQPFYALRARGILEGETPTGDLEAMAAEYLETVRAVRPHGPYLLGGWSMGGVVAYEMARQLEAAGERVDLVALLDSVLVAPDGWSPLARWKARRGDEARLLGAFAGDLGLDPGRLGITSAEVPKHGRAGVLARVLDAARAGGAVPPGLTLPEMSRLYEVFRANAEALRRYRPGPYGGAVTLVYTLEEDAQRQRLMEEAWRKLVAGEVDVHVVPGGHHDLIEEPNVREVAQHLAARIGRGS